MVLAGTAHAIRSLICVSDGKLHWSALTNGLRSGTIIITAVLGFSELDQAPSAVNVLQR